MTDELIGKKIGGYEILSLVGRGGMAAVYKAHQVSMNRTVALKILPRHYMNDENYLQRFHREVKIVSQLEHRSIVPVHDYGEHEGQPYIAMRYMSGGSVDDRLRDGALKPAEMLAIIEQIGPALDYAHSKDVLHRDLKPSNILMDDNGGAYITDFGIARILNEQGGTITTQGVIGTPSYMSPEQAQGRELDSRSDLYALGVMLFEMATGRRPFESDTPYSVAVMQVTNAPPSPRLLNGQISPALEKVILIALRKNRDERYPSAAALIDALDNAINHPDVALSDTQPNMVPEVTAPIQTQHYEQYAPPSEYAPPVYAPAPPPPQPAPAPASMSFSAPIRPVRAQKRRGRSNLWVSAILGSVIGCGLLTLVVALMFVIVQNNAREEANMLMTITAESEGTRTSRAQSDDEGDVGAVVTDPTNLPTDIPDPLVPTSLPAMVTNTPSGGATSVPVPVGERPTEDRNVTSDLSGSVIFYAERDRNFDIFRLELPSLVESRLTDHATVDSYPLVSPDGQWILFQSNRDGDFDLMLMEANGDNETRILQNSVIDRLGAWSPDGEWIAFSSDTRGDGNYDLFRVRPDGSDLQLLYSDGRRNSHPRYSPDGSVIIFTGGIESDASTWEVGRYEIGSGVVTFLTQNDIKDWSATYAPDGTILYLTNGAGYAAVARMNQDGSGQTIIYDGEGYESEVNSGPDGYILLSSDENGNDELYALRQSDNQLQMLTTSGGLYPSWTSE